MNRYTATFGENSCRWTTGWMIGGSSPDRGQEFSPHHRVQTGSEAHPASYTMSTRGSVPGGKADEAWNWPLTSIWCRGQECVELFLRSPIRLYGVVLDQKKKHRDNFTLYTHIHTHISWLRNSLQVHYRVARRCHWILSQAKLLQSSPSYSVPFKFRFCIIVPSTHNSPSEILRAGIIRAGRTRLAETSAKSKEFICPCSQASLPSSVLPQNDFSQFPFQDCMETVRAVMGWRVPLGLP
jgi:hypothetical protein